MIRLCGHINTIVHFIKYLLECQARLGEESYSHFHVYSIIGSIIPIHCIQWFNSQQKLTQSINIHCHAETALFEAN